MIHGSRVSWSAIVTALAIALVVAAVQSADAACPACGASPCTITGTHTIGSAETCNYAGKTVILSGTFNGDNNAACYTVIADNLNVRGTLRARGSCINVDVSGGEFKMEVVSNSASLVDVRNADSAGDGVTIDCATAVLNGNGINADADGDQSPAYFPAGDITITCSGNISGNGGILHADANGGDDGGIIEVTSTEGSINLGVGFHANGGGDFSFGGTITVDGLGDVTVGGATVRSLEAQPAQGGFSGEVSILSGEDITVNGSMNVSGSGEDSDGGFITVDGDSLNTGTTWNARGDNGGDGGEIDVFALDGTGTVTTTAGAASWNVQGASFPDDGGWGGFIFVSALGDVSLVGDMDAAGSGDDAFGGDIDIGTDADITMASTSRIEADSTGTDADDGTIELTGCNMTIDGDVDTRNTNLNGPTGTNTVDYAGTFTQNSASDILADDGGGNDFSCACPDTSPQNGICDSATCVNSPTFGGTVTPSATVTAVFKAACS